MCVKFGIDDLLTLDQRFFQPFHIKKSNYFLYERYIFKKCRFLRLNEDLYERLFYTVRTTRINLLTFNDVDSGFERATQDLDCRQHRYTSQVF
jgi:TFIIF-interacting CTD phosphatase-like protein